MRSPRKTVALLTVGIGVVLAALSGCSSEVAALAPTADPGWSERMSGLLNAADSSAGGGSGELARGTAAHPSRAAVILGSIPPARYDVLGVCTGTDLVHLSITKTGGVATPTGADVLASSDIACGSTLRLPVTSASEGMKFTVSSTSGAARWQIFVVAPGWYPAPTTYSR